jgi:hypothetical protein
VEMIRKNTTQISIGIFTYKTGEVQSKQTCKRHRKRGIIELLCHEIQCGNGRE